MSRPPNGSSAAAVMSVPQPPAEPDLGVRVLIADADGLARGMMRSALANGERIAVVHAAANGREALELARYYQLSVAIVDTVVPPRGAVELVERLLLEAPGHAGIDDVRRRSLDCDRGVCGPGPSGTSTRVAPSQTGSRSWSPERRTAR